MVSLRDRRSRSNGITDCVGSYSTKGFLCFGRRGTGAVFGSYQEKNFKRDGGRISNKGDRGGGLDSNNILREWASAVK